MRKIIEVERTVTTRKVAGDDWNSDIYNTVDIRIELELAQYDRNGGGYGKDYLIDMCPVCFVGRFIKWIENCNKVIIKPVKWEY